MERVDTGAMLVPQPMSSSPPLPPQQKLNLLLSDEAELRRRLQYYEWLDEFLRYEKEVVDPVEFLASCRHHIALLKVRIPLHEKGYRGALWALYSDT